MPALALSPRQRTLTSAQSRTPDPRLATSADKTLPQTPNTCTSPRILSNQTYPRLTGVANRKSFYGLGTREWRFIQINITAYNQLMKSNKSWRLNLYRDRKVLENIWCCSECSSCSFLYFTRVRKFGKTFSANVRVGSRTVKGTHEGYEDEARSTVRHLCKRSLGSGVLVKHFFY